MSRGLDCRGLVCPAPVLKTREHIKEKSPDFIKVIVDNEAAKENVLRFLESQNFEVNIEAEGADFHLTGQRRVQGVVPETTVSEGVETEKKNIMVMVAADRMGHGDDELGSKLMVNFINTLKEMGDELWRLVLVNNGVKLTIEDSEVLPALKDLEADGIQILVCGTCLSYFDLLDKKKVGETTNMLDIVTAMQLADKVINI